MRLDYNFYQRNAVTVAEELLGKTLVRKYDNKLIKVKIVETEAYQGPADKASHAYNNKRTKRTETMFKKGGLAYIYLIYGMYYCFNIVTGKVDDPQAVLIRAVESTAGLELIRKNRNIKSNKTENLTNGPGKLSEALKINKSFDGYDLVKGDKLYLIDDQDNQNDHPKKFMIERAPRINIDYAEDYKDIK